jgi:hypothetical protein
MADQIDFTPDAQVTPPPTAAAPATAPTINFTPDPPVNPNAGKTFAQADPNAAEQAPELADTTPTPDVGTHMSGKQVAMALGGLALPVAIPAAGAALGLGAADAAGETAAGDAASQLGPKAAQALKAQLEKNGFSNVVPKPSAFVSPSASRAAAQAAAEDAESQVGPQFLQGYKAAQAASQAATGTSTAASSALANAGKIAGGTAAGTGALAALKSLYGKTVTAAEHGYFLTEMGQKAADKIKDVNDWFMNQ